MIFSKWQGCGNDFVLLDDSAGQLSAAGHDWATLARRLCQRHFGVGADGLIVAQPSTVAEWRMRVFNADGSEAEMCGNGIRCLARWLHERGLVATPAFTVETGAGVLTPELRDDGTVRVDMGEPVIDAAGVPTLGFAGERVVDEPLTLGDGTAFNVTCVSMGNPHCVIFVNGPALNEMPERHGAALERDRHFPRKANVEFVAVRNRNNLRLRVWERGAGVTLACGTGACAALVAAVLNGLCERVAGVALDGGTLRVEWSPENNHVYMTGAAVKVFEGEIGA